MENLLWAFEYEGRAGRQVITSTSRGVTVEHGLQIL